MATIGCHVIDPIRPPAVGGGGGERTYPGRHSGDCSPTTSGTISLYARDNLWRLQQCYQHGAKLGERADGYERHVQCGYHLNHLLCLAVSHHGDTLTLQPQPRKCKKRSYYGTLSV